MEQIATTVLVSYGATYALKYTFEYITYNIFKRTTKKAKKVVTNMIYPRKKKPIEYQLINIDSDKRIITDETVYVSSKPRKQPEKEEII
jgi:hypothetical protein